MSFCNGPSFNFNFLKMAVDIFESWRCSGNTSSGLTKETFSTLKIENNGVIIQTYKKSKVQEFLVNFLLIPLKAALDGTGNLIAETFLCRSINYFKQKKLVVLVSYGSK